MRVLRIRPRTGSDVTSAGVAALVARCAALEELVIFYYFCIRDTEPWVSDSRHNAWAPEDVSAVLRAAAAAASPLRFLYVPFVGVASFDALTALPRLHTLVLDGALQVCVTPEQLLPALEVLPRLRSLHTLRLRLVCHFGEEHVLRPFNVRSDTLRGFFLAGNIPGLSFNCPQLVDVDVSKGFEKLKFPAAALALIRGCPLLRWRTPPEAAGSAAAPPEQAVQAWRTEVSNALVRQPGDAQLRELLDNVDAVRFMLAIERGAIVNGEVKHEQHAAE